MDVRGVQMVAASLRRAARVARGELNRAMVAALADVHGDLVSRTFRAKRAPDGILRGGGQGGLAVDTGKLRASLTWRVFERDGMLAGAVGSNVPWLPIHEYGGTIRGRPWLAIPTVYAQKYAALIRAPRGAPRGQRSGFALRSIPRNAEAAKHATLYRTFVKWDRAHRNLWVWVRTNDGIVPVLLLKRSVQMPARRMFEQTAQAVAPRAAARFQGAVTFVVRAADGH